MKKVLIFGIAGFVGTYLTEEFLSHGYSVSGSDIAASDSFVLPVEFHAADLLDASAVDCLVEKIAPDIIANLAAISSVGASWGIPQTTMQVNVIGALNIMEAARKYAINAKILFVGSSEEYDFSDVPMDESSPLNAKNPYGISKMTQERFAQIYREQYGMKIYYVRPFNHTGIGQKETFVLPSFCKQVAEIEKSGKPGVLKVGNLAIKRDFSNVKDIVRAYRMIVEQDDCATIFNVGSGTAYSLDELLCYIVSLCKQPITIEVDPARIRGMDAPLICCDANAIQSALGWKPEFDVFETLKEMFKELLEER